MIENGIAKKRDTEFNGLSLQALDKVLPQFCDIVNVESFGSKVTLVH